MNLNIESHSFAGEKILCFRLPGHEKLNRDLLSDLDKGRPDFTYSHRINNRWENSYLPIEKVPAAREVIKSARDVAVQSYGKRLLALYKPVGNCPRLPFWFNLAESGEITGVHNHANEAEVSGVYYILTPLRSGNLFFRAEGEEDFVVEPVEGKFVLFPSGLRHGVTENLSSSIRISLAFNIFRIPLALQGED